MSEVKRLGWVSLTPRDAKDRKMAEGWHFSLVAPRDEARNWVGPYDRSRDANNAAADASNEKYKANIAALKGN